jgi:outer membrane lipoprotein SlyB
MGNLIDGFFETKVGAFIGGAVLGGVFGAVVCHGSTKPEYLPAPAPALEGGKKKKKKDKAKKDE